MCASDRVAVHDAQVLGGACWEWFSLTNHAARDMGRYNVVKDINRLERSALAGPRVVGHAILLTNGSSYWTSPSRSTTIDYHRLPSTRPCNTMRGYSERGARLGGACWHDYSRVGGNSNGGRVA